MKLPEETKKIETFPKFQRWMKKTNILQASFIILKIDLETFDVETETGITESQEAIDDNRKCKHKQEDGYWYEHSSTLHGS